MSKIITLLSISQSKEHLNSLINERFSSDVLAPKTLLLDSGHAYTNEKHQEVEDSVTSRSLLKVKYLHFYHFGQ